MSSIRSFHGFNPEVSPTAYVDPAAHVIGHVAVGHDSSVWPGAVIRGDAHRIRIGERTKQIYYAARQYVKLKAQYLAPTRESSRTVSEYDRRVAAAV